MIKFELYFDVTRVYTHRGPSYTGYTPTILTRRKVVHENIIHYKLFFPSTRAYARQQIKLQKGNPPRIYTRARVVTKRHTLASTYKLDASAVHSTKRFAINEKENQRWGYYTQSLLTSPYENLSHTHTHIAGRCIISYKTQSTYLHTLSPWFALRVYRGGESSCNVAARCFVYWLKLD